MGDNNENGENDDFENSENGNGENGNGDATVQYRRQDGVEKDGYICFPVETEVDVAEEEDVEGPPPPPERYDLGTCPDDPRFQQTNKSGWCYRMYIDYHRCRNLLGDNAKQCNYFYNCYQSICPNSWHEKWDDQLKAGTFPRDITRELQPPKKPHCP